MAKALTIYLPNDLVDKVIQVAARSKLTVSELVRGALLVHLGQSPDKHHHALTMYEIAKTRALLVEFMDLQHPGKAEDAAKKYVEEQEGKEQ
jgi:hypothetical protein